MHRMRWTLEKIQARLRLLGGAVYRRELALPPFELQTQRDSNDEWRPLAPGSFWGALRQDFVLRTQFQIPHDWPEPFALQLPLGTSASLEALAFLYGPEALAYLDDHVYQGINAYHQEILLSPQFQDGREHTVTLYGWTGIKDERYQIGQPALVQIDQPTRDLVATVRVALAVVRNLAAENPVRAKLLNALDAAFLLLDLREPFGDAFYESVPHAHHLLRERIAKAGAPSDVNVTAAGHSHIDVAWLWTTGQTRQKAARTFSTVLRLMEQYPEFYFTQSQPQLYQYIEQDHPALMTQIQARVGEGRWEPIGGMWVEADCNITGAEALVRQFILGRRYFSEHFGTREAPVLWLPDVFGYAWQLPQLMRGAGINYFVTAKLSWNQYNRIPYDSFWWKGLDGTRVLTHFITTAAPGWWGATYSANLTPDEVLETWKGNQQKELSPNLLIPFGQGDGGGGPTREMIENGRAMAAHPGLPRVHFGSALEFLQGLETASGVGLPVWNGELYLELHRGTYTSQARNKRSNRKSETLLHDAEFLAAWASLEGAPYPHAELARAWELVCLNQFHDIIPGSSINEVYRDSAKEYQEISAIGERIRQEASAHLSAFMPAGSTLAIFNPTSFPRTECIEIPEAWLGENAPVSLPEGTPLAMQRTKDKILIQLLDLPPYGCAALAFRRERHDPFESAIYAGVAEQAPHSQGTRGAANIVLENAMLRAEFDLAGDLIRLFDKRVAREVLASNTKANQWQAFQDRPLDWDAWDIDIFYDEQQWLAEPAHHIEVIETGPLRACLEIQRTILNSHIRQRIYLYHNSARLDFETHMDWQERHVLLKIAFPVDILTPKATYEIQWGNVERPTHRNTSWDWARFESCAHKWVDLSESDYGVSLLNDCKYGHDIHDNVLRLTLLKSPTFPDPTADLGEHEFTYSLFPHVGDWRGSTSAAAYALNDPLIVASVASGTSRLAPARSLVRVSAPQVIIETVKRAEDGNGLIVRMYESERTHVRAQVSTVFPIGRAVRCNLLEEDAGELDVVDGQIGIELHPYEIVTLRLLPKG